MPLQTKYKLLFANIGWMTFYRGCTDNDQIVGGGSKGDVDNHEIYNFLPIKGYFYGYVQPDTRYKTIAVERLVGSKSKEENVDDVLVVWTSTRQNGGTVIIGWYKNATVYRTCQKIHTPERNDYGYYVKARTEDCVLLTPDERTFIIPRKRENGNKKGLLGKSNIWYADSDDEYIKNLRTEVIKYISDYQSKFSETHRQRKINVDEKRKVEESAIKVVTERYKVLGYNVKSVEKKNKGWDLEASLNNSELLHIEVKGLKYDDLRVHISTNEYSKMTDPATNFSYRLCVVLDALSDSPTLSTFSLINDKWICQETGLELKFDEQVAAVAHV